MFTIFVAAVAVSVFVMYFRYESQLRRKRRDSSAPSGGEPPAQPGSNSTAQPGGEPPADPDAR